MTSSLALGVMVVIAIGFAVNLVRLQGRLWSEGRGLPLEGLAASRGWQYVAEDPTWAAMVTGEDRIAAARRFYNGNVRALNTRVETIPSALVASLGGFTQAEYFLADEGELRTVPTVGQPSG